jgi:septal ring factor EnvC (AmiA/AmiB activator)
MIFWIVASMSTLLRRFCRLADALDVCLVAKSLLSEPHLIPSACMACLLSLELRTSGRLYGVERRQFWFRLISQESLETSQANLRTANSDRKRLQASLQTATTNLTQSQTDLQTANDTIEDLRLQLDAA